jgi:anti-sigma regulatory factor (Ser/Thr protein kinase)
MACIIVRIAGRPATCALLIPMTTDSSRVELLVPNDERLIAAIAAVVAHAGGRAGLSRQEQAELAHSTEEACEETFASIGRNGHPVLRVIVSDFPNRVEVSLEDSAARSATSPDDLSRSASREPDPVTAALQGMQVDRLHHEIHEGKPRTTLVKYHEPGRPHRGH